MRLLELHHDGSIQLTRNLESHDKVPAYAILSHTWLPDQEVTFDELTNGTGHDKAGYDKIRFCAQQAQRDGLRYFWVDTCCINKADIVELQHAINSMFRWYRDAARCYVFLSDVSITKRKADSEFVQRTWELAFRCSRWFTRGWTLQELLAPRVVNFFSREGQLLGDRVSLKQIVHEITSIPILALTGAPLESFRIDERISWSEGRQTKHVEDKAYSLLGMFGVFIYLNYGEGENNAFKRLQKAIAEELQGLSQPPASMVMNQGHSITNKPSKSGRNSTAVMCATHSVALTLKLSTKLPTTYPSLKTSTSSEEQRNSNFSVARCCRMQVAKRCLL